MNQQLYITTIVIRLFVDVFLCDKKKLRAVYLQHFFCFTRIREGKCAQNFFPVYKYKFVNTYLLSARVVNTFMKLGKKSFIDITILFVLLYKCHVLCMLLELKLFAAMKIAFENYRMIAFCIHSVYLLHWVHIEIDKRTISYSFFSNSRSQNYVCTELYTTIHLYFFCSVVCWIIEFYLNAKKRNFWF